MAANNPIVKIVIYLLTQVKSDAVCLWRKIVFELHGYLFKNTYFIKLHGASGFLSPSRLYNDS